MENFGGRKPSDGLSETASKLVEQSKAEGTRKLYKSAWNSFQCWCSERKVDPFTCPLEEIMNYLTHLFEEGKGYSAINGHRSAISSLHQLVEGVPIGQHPKISTLMRGIAREKPPVPKYTHIWDIDKVLNHFRSMPNNEDLNLKALSLKTITLLGLIAPKRGAELTELDTELMGKSDSTFAFYLIKPAKHFKPGKKNNTLEFRKFELEKKLCPYSALETYIKTTAALRDSQKTSKLFISYVKPHKPVGKDTTARWVREMLSITGIDPKVYQPHSKRSASTSKAFAKGTSLNDILEMGNWSNKSVWQRFYHKNFSTAERYQDQILEE